jgi:hypothetical protein
MNQLLNTVANNMSDLVVLPPTSAKEQTHISQSDQSNPLLINKRETTMSQHMRDDFANCWGCFLFPEKQTQKPPAVHITTPGQLVTLQKRGDTVQTIQSQQYTCTRYTGIASVCLLSH